MPESEIFQFLEIADIRDGVVIMKDRSLRAILLVSAINFVLKSEEEKTAIISMFHNFLNSLDFSIQIAVLSRRMNITPYLDKILELEKKQTNELLKIQTRDYRKFIENLVKTGLIMSKTFLVIIPFYPITLGKRKGEVILNEEEFQRAKTQLFERVQFVALELRRCGLEAIPLGTAELIDLFWSFYHQEEAESGYYPEIPPELLT